MNSQEHLAQVHRRLAPLREELLNHALYARINSLPALRLFMEHHVFAVWDFMSLLKALQRGLCCVTIPWVPPAPGDRLGARFVNEIVLGEESDDDAEGGYASHFDLYHRAMVRCGADTRWIDAFLAAIRGGAAVGPALAEAGVPATAGRFVQRTFAFIEGGDLCVIAAAFTFGREALLPDVFQRIVDELNVEAGGGLKDFLYYLNRHIELDGGEHGPMAGRLMASLCGEDEGRWGKAELAAAESLRARKALWDGMLAAMDVVQARG